MIEKQSHKGKVFRLVFLVILMLFAYSFTLSKSDETTLAEIKNYDNLNFIKSNEASESNIYYVDQGKGSDEVEGGSKEEPFKTLSYAFQ